MDDQTFVHKSGSIENITKAMVAFQANIGHLVKSAKGQFDYAPLEDILSYVIPKLNICGIHLEQSSITYGDDVFLRTTVTHISGEFKSSFDYLYPKDLVRRALESSKDAGKLQQTLGTIKRYQCRYALQFFLCIPIMEPDFDDKPCITDEQSDILYNMAKGDQEILANFMEQLGVKSSIYIKEEDYEAAVDIMKILCNKGS